VFTLRRFTDEVSKTNDLEFSIAATAVKSEPSRQTVDNNYSLNTVDICPVGALTSKDFRFRQRGVVSQRGRLDLPRLQHGLQVKVKLQRRRPVAHSPARNKE